MPPLTWAPAAPGSGDVGTTGTVETVEPVRQGCRRPGVLLDRDGTIIHDLGYIGTVERVQMIDGAAEAIRGFNVAGIPVVVVTNQSGVARGLFSVEDVERVHRHIGRQLETRGAHIDEFFFCPYHPQGVVTAFTRSSEDRKPRPGMALAAAAAFDLDLEMSWVIGDRPEDLGLAEAVGAQAVFLGRGSPPGVTRRRNLFDAASLVLGRIAA